MNIFKDLKVTENVAEQIAIGKEIAETYTEANFKQIYSYFDKVNNWEEKFDLSKEDMLYKAIYDNWVYGFRPEQQFWYDLPHKTHEEKKTFMSQMEDFIYYARLNRKKDMLMFEDKYETYKMFKPYYKREVIKLSSEEDYELFLDFLTRHPKFVMKPLGLHDTAGVQLIDSDEYEDKKKLFYKIVNIGHEYLDDYTYLWCNHNSAVLEEVIQMSEEFGRFNPKALHVVRVPTIRANGKVTVFGAYLKIGITDDLIVGESRTGSVISAADIKTGKLITDGHYENGDCIAVHPTSKIPFKGYQIPEWDDMVKIATDLVAGLPPYVNYIAWDFVHTPKGWVIVEGNFYGQSLWQMCFQRGMKKEFEELIGWHMDENKFWWQYKTKQVEKEAGLHDF